MTTSNDNEPKMPFGIHKGKNLSEVPDNYWLYLYDRKQLKGKLLEWAEENVAILRFMKERREQKK